MSLLDYGLSSGLAYRHNFQQDIANAQRNEMLDRQARIDAENKTKLFADELKFGDVTTDYNKQQLKQYTEQLIPQIGKFVNDNPDYRTNTMKYAQYKQMTDGLLKNKWVQNDMYFQGMQKEYAKHIAKHPEDVNRPEILAMANNIERYKKTGDVLGEVGKDRQFEFAPPLPYSDLEKESTSVAKAFEAFDYKSAPELGRNARVQIPKEKELQQQIDSFYKINKNQFDNQASDQGFLKGRDWAESLIRNKVPHNIIQIPEDQERMLNLRTQAKLGSSKPTEDVWTNNYLNKDRGAIKSDVMQTTFGSKAAKAYLLNDDVRHEPEDLSGHNIERTGEFVTFAKNYPRIDLRGKKANIGYINMPIEWGIGKGFYQNDQDVAESSEDLGEKDIQKSKLGKASISKDEKGKTVLRLKVYETPDLNNTQYGVLMNGAVLPTKLEPGEIKNDIQENPMSGSGKYYWDGTEWIATGK